MNRREYESFMLTGDAHLSDMGGRATHRGRLPISKTQVCRIPEPGILITILFWQVVGGKLSSTQLGEYAPSVLQDAAKGGGSMPFWGCHRVLPLASLVGFPSYQCYRLSL